MHRKAVHVHDIRGRRQERIDVESIARRMSLRLKIEAAAGLDLAQDAIEDEFLHRRRVMLQNNRRIEEVNAR